MFRFLVIVFGTLFSVVFFSPTYAKARSANTSTVTILWPPIPQGEMSRLVPEAMKQARLGNSDLAASVSRRSDEALPYLEKFSRENDDNVRSAVERIASVSHSPRALHLLANNR